MEPVKGEAAGPIESERRAAPRHTLAALPWELRCRVMPGHKVHILNLSVVGLLVESAAPLFPFRAAKVNLERGAGLEMHLALTGRVVRSHIITINRESGAKFVSAIQFEDDVATLRDLWQQFGLDWDELESRKGEKAFRRNE
jgi:hypothetical protein